MLTPATLSEGDLRALALLLPENLRLSLEGGRLLLTMRSLHAEPASLFTLEIAPGSEPDYSGSLLGEFLAGLGGALSGMHRGLENSPLRMEGRIAKVTGEAVAQTTTRLLPRGEFRLRLVRVHTREAGDWYGLDAQIPD